MVISNVIKRSSCYKCSLRGDYELADAIDSFDVKNFRPSAMTVNQGDAFKRFLLQKVE